MLFRVILKVVALVAAVGCLGCSSITQRHLDDRYGVAEPVKREVQLSSLTAEQVNFWKEVKPILDRRCVVCHSCYDAPCQLKLASPEGLDRGATKDKVYDPFRLSAAEPSRLYIDALNTREWRQRGFFPVLNERAQTEEANREASIIFRLLRLKQSNPLPAAPLLPSEITVGLDRVEQCPRIEEMDSFERDYPHWGMPYGLPAIPETEQRVLTRWVEQGGLVPERDRLGIEIRQEVARWETFLNGQSLKERLMSRYLYEHLFLGDLYFDEVGQEISFKLVRSKTPPGTDIIPIKTARPYDSPGEEPFYYRLMENRETQVAKTHMPYALNPKRMTRYKQLFLRPKYTVEVFPSYELKVASNPFLTFNAIPASSRYRFLLDEAHFIVTGFIKGPVCQGRTALNVIEDRFWVFFTDPDKDPFIGDNSFFYENSSLLQLPSEKGSDVSIWMPWRRYKEKHEQLLEAKRRHFRSHLGSVTNLTLGYIWDGERTNTSAALTIFRHFDSASVEKGTIGAVPKTAWIIDFPLLERVHYLLAAGFDVYGNIGHQTMTRLYMDFLRIEGEDNFLAFLPAKARVAEKSFWYRGIGAGNLGEYSSESPLTKEDPGIEFRTDNPKSELFTKIDKRLGRANQIHGSSNATVPPQLERLRGIRGSGVSYLPDSSLLRVELSGGRSEVYSLTVDRGYSNVAVLFLEDLRRLPEEDELTVTQGFLGSYPNAFFRVKESELDNFVTLLTAVDSESDYGDLKDRFGVRRTSPDFWMESDLLQAEYLRSAKGSGGVLDYSRLENR